MKKTKTNISPKEKINVTIPKQQDNTSPSKRNNKLLVLIILIIVLAGLFIFKKVSADNQINSFKKNIIPAAIKKVINNPDTKFSVGEVKEVNGVFEIALDVAGQKYTSYITKDGKLLFISGVKLDTLNAQTNTNTTTTKKITCNDLKKTDATNLTAFIVANCPYGLQMQRVFNKAITEAPEILNNLNVKYIGSIENGKITSMHGDVEAQENLKQICIREEQQDKYWPYVACYMKAGKSEECSTTAGINLTQLNSCITDANKGLKFAKIDFDLANKLQVGSSPTLVLNDTQVVSEFDFGGRVADSLAQIVCCSSNTKPGFCSKPLSKTEVASAFSTTEAAASGTTNNAANCGTTPQ